MPCLQTLGGCYCFCRLRKVWLHELDLRLGIQNLELTPRNASRQQAFFAEIREAYPEYRIAIIHVFASWDAMQKRSTVTREGGRVTSPKALRTSFNAVTSAVAELEPLADLTLHINNDGFPPQMLYMTLGRKCRKVRKWNEVRTAFLQGPGVAIPLFRSLLIFIMLSGLACLLLPWDHHLGS